MAKDFARKMADMDDAAMVEAIAKKKGELDALQKRLQMKAELARLTQACETTQSQIDAPASAAPAAAPPAKKMRTADGSSAAAAAAEGGGSDSGPGWYSLNAKGTKRLVVSVFSGKIMVSLREYYADKASGEMKPGKKGVSLDLHEWHQFKKHAPECTTKREQQQAFELDLGRRRKMSVTGRSTVQ